MTGIVCNVSRRRSLRHRLALAAAIAVAALLLAGSWRHADAQTPRPPLPGFARVTGRVVDAQGAALPRVTVAASTVGTDRPGLSTDSGTDGTFTVEPLEPGAYLVAPQSSAFTGLPVRVTLHAGDDVEVTLRAWSTAVRTISRVYGPLPELFREVDAVALVGVAATPPPVPCEESLWVHHVAQVLTVVKGTLPPTIWLEDNKAMSCLQNGAPTDRQAPSVVGREYLVFLTRQGQDYVMTLPFAIEKGRIASPAGFDPLLPGTTIKRALEIVRGYSVK